MIPGLHQLDCGEKPGSCESMSYDALDVNVLTLCRAPKLEEDEFPGSNSE